MLFNHVDKKDIAISMLEHWNRLWRAHVIFTWNGKNALLRYWLMCYSVSLLYIVYSHIQIFILKALCKSHPVSKTAGVKMSDPVKKTEWEILEMKNGNNGWKEIWKENQEHHKPELPVAVLSFLFFKSQYRAVQSWRCRWYVDQSKRIIWHGFSLKCKWGFRIAVLIAKKLL